DNTVNVSGGFIIQLMPFAEEEVIEKLEQRIGIINSVTNLLVQFQTPENILDFILGDMDLKILEKIPIHFYCNCSKERVEKAIISIGKKEIQELIKEEETVEVNCHFCSTSYHFTVDELKEIYKKSK